MKRRMFRNGRPMLVIRPDDPEKAVRIAQETANANNIARFKGLPEEVGEYTVVGYASEDARKIVDKMGNVIGEIKRGDSFITMPVDPPIGSRFRTDPSNVN